MKLAPRMLFFLRAMALAVWLGGLVTLGAVVAPVVFRVVPAPWGADAMTVVFRRFDHVALACGAVLGLAEAIGSRVESAGSTRGSLVRALFVVLATALAGARGFFLSPKIEALHRGGAIRGLGELGLELESIHRWAERLAQIELLVLVGILFLVAPRANKE